MQACIGLKLNLLDTRHNIDKVKELVDMWGYDLYIDKPNTEIILIFLYIPKDISECCTSVNKLKGGFKTSVKVLCESAGIWNEEGYGLWNIET